MKKILTFVAILLLTACGRSVKMRDLQYEEGDRSNIKFYVYYEDKAFDGEAWSDDGRSFKIIADSGIMKPLCEELFTKLSLDLERFIEKGEIIKNDW